MSGLSKELLIAVVMLAVGFFALPPAIYLVGQRVIGEYAQAGGMLALAEQIWLELLAPSPLAWLLVLSPYVAVQLVRLALAVWRARPV